MKSSKIMAALVTLGLAAAVATPAMALENQFSGSFTTFYDISNYSASGNFGGTSNFEGLTKDSKTRTILSSAFASATPPRQAKMSNW